jgi:hypothetical protein
MSLTLGWIGGRWKAELYARTSSMRFSVPLELSAQKAIDLDSSS